MVTTEVTRASEVTGWGLMKGFVPFLSTNTENALARFPCTPGDECGKLSTRQEENLYQSPMCCHPDLSSSHQNYEKTNVYC